MKHYLPYLTLLLAGCTLVSGPDECTEPACRFESITFALESEIIDWDNGRVDTFAAASAAFYYTGRIPAAPGSPSEAWTALGLRPVRLDTNELRARGIYRARTGEVSFWFWKNLGPTSLGLTQGRFIVQDDADDLVTEAEIPLPEVYPSLELDVDGKVVSIANGIPYRIAGLDAVDASEISLRIDALGGPVRVLTLPVVAEGIIPYKLLAGHSVAPGDASVVLRWTRTIPSTGSGVPSLLYSHFHRIDLHLVP